MSIEEKFNAAVNVIRSLPKSGSYQPSNELMLRFYSYFKQATDGPCNKPKPGFWDIVNRAKWEAWNRLGNMTKTEAMNAYVDELHKIVETMSYSDNVASFLSATDEDDMTANFPSADLELVAGDVLQRVRSEHNTPIGSRSVSRTPSPPPRSHDRESDEEFIDTIDHSVVEPLAAPPVRQTQMSNGHAHQYTQSPQMKVLESLPATLSRLERDVAALRAAVEGDRALLARPGWRWPWEEVGPATLMLLLVWPFVAMRLQGMFAPRRK